LQFQFGKDEGGEYVVLFKEPQWKLQGKADEKVIKQYAQPQFKEQYYVNLLRFYLSKLPQIASEKDVFY